MTIYMVTKWNPTEPADRTRYFYANEVEADKQADALRGSMWYEVSVTPVEVYAEYHPTNKPAPRL